MMKLGWGLVNDRDSLWVKVIRGKYGCGNDLMPQINAKRPGSNTWSGIKQNWKKVEEGIQVIIDRNGTERARWRWEKNGAFSVRSAYSSLNAPGVNPNALWKEIWKLKIPQRSKTFAWLMLHERLITNEVKYKRHLHPNDECIRCKNTSESLIHALRDCPKITSFWKSIIHQKYHDLFFTIPMHDWFCHNLKTNHAGDKGYWKNLFVVICWLLWQNRNAMVHENNNGEIDRIYDHATAILSRMNEAVTKLKPVDLNKRMTVVNSSSDLMESGKIYVLVDGAFSYATMTATCGGVIMDNNRSIREGFISRLISGDALSAELWGCLLGLKRAWDGGFKNVVLRTDSLDAILLLKEDTPDMHEDWVLIEEIKNMLKWNWRVECQHLDRDENWIADTLAKHALNDNPGLLILGPDSVLAILDSDGIG